MSEFTRRLSFYLAESQICDTPLPASFFRENGRGGKGGSRE